MNQLDPKFINQILHTDCVEGMKQLPDCCIPFTLTSPPYDDLREYGGHRFDFEAVAGELWRITMQGGVVVWVVGEEIKKGSETGTAARQKLHFIDLGFRCSTMVMVTTRVRFPQRVRYPSVFDYAFVLTKGRPRHVNIIRDKPNRWAGSCASGTSDNVTARWLRVAGICHSYRRLRRPQQRLVLQRRRRQDDR